MRELHQQAGQLLILGFDGSEVTPRLRALLAELGITPVVPEGSQVQ